MSPSAYVGNLKFVGAIEFFWGRHQVRHSLVAALSGARCLTSATGMERDLASFRPQRTNDRQEVNATLQCPLHTEELNQATGVQC
jgi:hypothetical protein